VMSSLRILLWCLSALAGLAAANALLRADDPVATDPTAATSPKVDFAKRIQPLLAEKCYACHGPKKATSGLRLSRGEEAFRGGDSGKAIGPGKSGESLLIQLVSGADADRVMPPEGERLTKEQIDLLRSWIDQGADWPAAADAVEVAGREHWAYQAP